MFLRFLIDDANVLHDQPAFYNTILDNCLTNLLKHGVRVQEISRTDSRVLLPGRTDRLTYALGITPDDIPFEEARKRATVNPRLADIDEPGFSTSLRCGWAGYIDLDNPVCDTG